ncbi:hypothetical protein MMC10_007903 [Thelotrema lepadinum]|nr:hypothetical protein [Thelotrema lepadinum]
MGNLTWFAIDYYRNPRSAGKRWPEPIATYIKRAEGHIRVNSKPEVAMEYFKRALDAIEELGMPPTQQEVIDLRFNIALFLDNFHQPHAAIATIKSIQDDCQTWLKRINRGRLNPERTRLLSTLISTYVRLGELYANERINEFELAEASYLTAAETCVRETHRRATHGVKENEGEWMTNDEIGATLERAADTFEEKSLHALAAPLYLRAITLSRKSCHAAVLMNNLAISLAQTLPERVVGGPPSSRGVLVANARAWAEKALTITNSLEPPERNEECDVACAVATHNLGEFAEMEGLVEEARRKYVEAESLARVTQFWDGVRNAREGIRRLDKKVASGGM